MKPASRAPAFLMLYRGLCEIARRHGYALAVHGTMEADLDLIAVPWVDEVSDADALIEALAKHIDAIIDLPHTPDYKAVTKKPHGRVAVNLYMQVASKVDLSVLPRGTAQ